MCFSAGASFAGAVVISAVGITSLIGSHEICAAQPNHSTSAGPSRGQSEPLGFRNLIAAGP